MKRQGQEKVASYAIATAVTLSPLIHVKDRLYFECKGQLCCVQYISSRKYINMLLKVCIIYCLEEHAAHKKPE